MNFDLDFCYLELEAAVTGVIPPALFSHPVFQSVTAHEAAMDRPLLDESRFRDHFRAAAAGEADCWGLTSLFRDPQRVFLALEWIDASRDSIALTLCTRLAHFTSAMPRPGLRCVLYAGTLDGGFKLGNDDGTIYINLCAVSCREAFIETLSHESYHARETSCHSRRLVRRIEKESDYLGAVLYSTFEEGTADFVGYNGATTSKYPVIPLRTPEEGLRELKQLLDRYARGALSAEALYVTFKNSDCCYTAGAAIAGSIWEQHGVPGIDLWAVDRDLNAFYSAFRATPSGRDWPELKI